MAPAAARDAEAGRVSKRTWSSATEAAARCCRQLPAKSAPASRPSRHQRRIGCSIGGKTPSPRQPAIAAAGAAAAWQRQQRQPMLTIQQRLLQRLGLLLLQALLHYLGRSLHLRAAGDDMARGAAGVRQDASWPACWSDGQRSEEDGKRPGSRPTGQAALPRLASVKPAVPPMAPRPQHAQASIQDEHACTHCLAPHGQHAGRRGRTQGPLQRRLHSPALSPP